MNTTSNHRFRLSIPVSKIYAVLKWVILINILFLIGTWLHHSKIIMPSKTTMQLVLVQFNLSRENVAASWYSSMLLFTVAIIALICFWADKKKGGSIFQQALHFGWIVIAGIFTMLSYDEMGSFHEMIGETAIFKKAGGSGGSSGWIVFYALIGIIAAFMISFFIIKFKGNKKSLLFTVLGVLLFVSNPFQEKFEINSWRAAADPSTWQRPVFFLLLEEGSELFAAFSFLYAFLLYAMNAAIGQDIKNNRLLSIESHFSNSVIAYLLGLAFLLWVVMFVVHLNTWHFETDDVGVPENWPPSATFFFCSISSLYVYFKFDHIRNKELYLLLAFTGFLLSVYYGANIYGYSEGFFGRLKYIMLIIVGITTCFSLIRFNGLFIKVFIIAWALLLGASVFKDGFYPAALGYSAGVSLLFALLLCYQGLNKKMVEQSLSLASL